MSHRWSAPVAPSTRAAPPASTTARRTRPDGAAGAWAASARSLAAEGRQRHHPGDADEREDRPEHEPPRRGVLDAAGDGRAR